MTCDSIAFLTYTCIVFKSYTDSLIFASTYSLCSLDLRCPLKHPTTQYLDLQFLHIRSSIHLLLPATLAFAKCNSLFQTPTQQLDVSQLSAERLQHPLRCGVLYQVLDFLSTLRETRAHVILTPGCLKLKGNGAIRG